MGCGPYEAFQPIREVEGDAESGARGRQRLVVSRADACGALSVVGGGGTRSACPELPGVSHLVSGPAGFVGGNELGC